jgi:hypothetical protein
VKIYLAAAGEAAQEKERQGVDWIEQIVQNTQFVQMLLLPLCGLSQWAFLVSLIQTKIHS